MRFLLTAVLVMGLIIVSVSPVFAQEDPGDDGWWPEFPDTEELVQTMLSVLVDSVVNYMVEELNMWYTQFKDMVLGWVQANWSLSGSGFLGSMLRLIFITCRNIAIPFISLSISLTFFQQWIIRIFPGLAKSLTIGQVMGRVIVVAMLLNPLMMGVLIDLMDTTNVLAFRIFYPDGGSALGFMAEWAWIETFFTEVVNTAPFALYYMIVGIVLALIVTITMIVALIVKQVLAVVVIGVLPLAALAWLYPITEGFWAKYWWMFIKLAIAPFVLALIVRIITTVMEMMGSNLIVGLIIILMMTSIGVWLFFKLLFMPETWMIAAGAALTATGVGGAAGISLIGGGVAKATSRVSPSTGQSAQQLVQSANMAYRIHQTDKK